MLSEMIFLLDSYSRRSLKIFVWYGLSDAFTKIWSGGLSCVCRWLQISFIALFFVLFLRLRQALCHINVFPTCFRHLKQDLNSKPTFLSTCWRNSPQQITTEAYCIWSTLCEYFLHEYGDDFRSRVAAHAPTKYQSNSTSGRGARASYRTMLPEISARRSLFGAKFQIPVARQGGREMSAPRPYLTEPFRPLSSINNC